MSTNEAPQTYIQLEGLASLGHRGNQGKQGSHWKQFKKLNIKEVGSLRPGFHRQRINFFFFFFFLVLR